MSKLNWSKVDRLVDEAMRDGLQALGNDIKKRSQLLSPYNPNRTEPGKHLRQTARVDVSVNPDKVTIGYYKEYAKRRHFENNLHPSTKYYLANAMKSIDNVKPYFRETF